MSSTLPKIKAKITPKITPKIKRYRLRSELAKAAMLDPKLTEIIQQVGYPQARTSDADFSTLAKIINSQQLSTQSAAAIWGRLESLCNGKVTHTKILNRGEACLLQCGLSRQKTHYILGMAQMVQSGELCLPDLMAAPDEAVIEQLVKIKGIGLWSAEIFAMFALGRRDFYPAGDLALRVAIQRYGQYPEKITEKQTREFAQRWSPHRSAVALLMWQYYGSTPA